MPIPQVSIRSLVCSVLLIAGDCAAVRMGLAGSAPLGLTIGILAILPMSNILAVASYRGLASRGSRRPFLLGFGSAGATVMLMCFYAFLMTDAACLHRLNVQFAGIFDLANRFTQRHIIYFRDNDSRNLYYAVLNVALLLLLTTTPQLLVALFGGWIARQCVSRPSPPPGGDREQPSALRNC
jgi:hypothetical protein